MLPRAADEIEEKHYRGALWSGGAVFLSVAVVAIMLMLATVGNSQSKNDASDGRTRKYEATSIRVKGRSALMYQDKNYFITQTRGPVGSEGIPETIKVGDVVTVKDNTIQVQHIFVTEFYEDMKYGNEILAEKGDVHCIVVQSLDNLPYVDEHEFRDRLWINVEKCEPLKVAMPKKDMSTTVNNLKDALARYQTVVGVFPKEFIGLSSIEQEAYVRGVLDGEYSLLEVSKHAGLDQFVICLNARITTIVSGAKRFVTEEGEQELLMPWTLSRLVGQTCPKKTRLPAEKPSEYTEASTSTKLVFMGKPSSGEKTFEKQQEAIDKAFIRGVLDGKVFILYGQRYPKLVPYLECLSKTGSLNKIFIAMRIYDAGAENLDKS